MTNGDKIRGMSNEELAEYVDSAGCGCNFCIGDRNSIECRARNCTDNIVLYLNQEATE